MGIGWKIRLLVVRWRGISWRMYCQMKQETDLHIQLITAKYQLLVRCKALQLMDSLTLLEAWTLKEMVANI